MKFIMIDFHGEYNLKIIYIMLYFLYIEYLFILTTFTLFVEFYNMLFHFFKTKILLNGVNYIYNFSMIVSNKTIILINVIPYSFNKNI